MNNIFYQVNSKRDTLIPTFHSEQIVNGKKINIPYYSIQNNITCFGYSVEDFGNGYPILVDNQPFYVSTSTGILECGNAEEIICTEIAIPTLWDSQLNYVILE